MCCQGQSGCKTDMLVIFMFLEYSLGLGSFFSGIVLDWMHTVDLGVAQMCLGNILWFVFLRLGGLVTREQEALSRIMNYLSDAANEIGQAMPFSKLTLGMIRGSDLRPQLRAKAAVTRRLVPIVLQMLHMHFPPVDDHSLRMVRCLDFLAKAYHELEHWGAGSASRLEVFCRRHVLLYLSLAEDTARGDGEWLLWRWKPKHHMLLHLSKEQAERMGNPSNWWCYQDENSIGIAVSIAESVHPSTLPTASMTKYLVSVFLSMLD